MNQLKPLLFALATLMAACGGDEPKETEDSGQSDGACPTSEEAGSCLVVSIRDTDGPVVEFSGDDGSAATYPGEDLDFFVRYAGDTIQTCLGELELDAGDTYPCTLVEIGGGCEPGYYVECD